MKRDIRYFALVFAAALTPLLLTGSDRSQDIDSRLKEIDNLYETRYLDPSNLDKAMGINNELISAGNRGERVLLSRARLCFFLGDSLEDKDAKVKYFDEGAASAKAAMIINDASDMAHFWYLANKGRTIQLKGVINALSAAKEVRKEINKVLILNPDHVGAISALASYYAEVPGILGGNIEKAERLMLEALSKSPKYTFLYVDLANIYMKMEKPGLAKYFLDKMMEIKDPVSKGDFEAVDKPNAQSIYKKIEESGFKTPEMTGK